MQLKNKILTIFFLVLTALMLTNSQISVYYALTGLNLWFIKMIPSLLPFMILSGIMVRMNLTEGFVSVVSPILTPLFRLRKNAIYCIFMGFLCGFPMGAKVITELYDRERLTKMEAEYLLSFCNNIGPIYFISFALPTIGVKKIAPCLFGMYGIPFIYGILLRYTYYKKLTYIKCKPVLKERNSGDGSLLFHLDDAINAALSGITSLGGYMIFFNLLNLIPHSLAMKMGQNMDAHLLKLSVINGLLEITSGIQRLGTSLPLLVLILLPLGGLSCIAQTYSILKKTDLSISKYVLHKVILTILTALFYYAYVIFFSYSLL